MKQSHRLRRQEIAAPDSVGTRNDERSESAVADSQRNADKISSAIFTFAHCADTLITLRNKSNRHARFCVFEMKRNGTQRNARTGYVCALKRNAMISFIGTCNAEKRVKRTKACTKLNNVIARNESRRANDEAISSLSARGAGNGFRCRIIFRREQERALARQSSIINLFSRHCEE